MHGLCRVMNALEVACPPLLLLLLCTGPWTAAIARLFELHRFETLDLRAAVFELLGRMLQAFARTWHLFLALPALVVLANSLAWERLRRARGILARACAIASVLGWGAALLIPRATGAAAPAPSPLTRTLLADAVLMLLWHLVLCARGALPAHTLLLGPLGGVSATLLSDAPPAPSPMVAVLFLLICIPNLISAYEAVGPDATLSFEGRLLDLPSIDLYAMLAVLPGFVMFCAYIPKIRTLGGMARTLAFIVMTNGNVAAAWAAWGVV